jgi:myo-inositol-1(or 4)-monophosphatase
MDLENDTRAALNAVRRAGKIVRSQWNEPRQITHKGRIDLVTQTDLAVEKDLKQRLEPIVPNASFLAEETASETGLDGPTWIIDPLDGTTNYAHSLPMVGISVALWNEGAVRLGIVYNPVLDELFWAQRGQGAFLNDRPIGVSTAESLEQSVVATGFPYTVRENIDDIMRWLRAVLLASQGVRRYGAAAVDLAWVACGRVDGFYEAGLQPWDTAAGWLLVEEAGGRVSRFDGSAYQLGARGILATNGRVHDALSHTLVTA